MPEPSAPLPCLWLAVLLDLLVRDPPNAVHPVAWMGKGIEAVQGVMPGSGRLRPLLAGAFVVLGGGALAGSIGLAVHLVSRSLPEPAGWLLEALVLKATFSVASLAHAGREVRLALQSGDLPSARSLLARHLVSRDTSALDESQTAAAAIESLAENTSDSVVAPLLFYMLAGLPGALAYRFINTCDAMLGYRDAGREWAGKVPARLDDLVNLIPARLTAGVILVAGVLLGRNPFRAVRVWWRDARATASPNAGHPMSAVAGVLNVELEKVGQYRLGEGQRPPEPDDLVFAGRLLWMTAGLTVIAVSALLAWSGDPWWAV